MSIAAAFGRPTAIYGPHNTVTCPDCGLPAVPELGGDHGGQCLDYLRLVPPNSALGIIRRHALRHDRFSAEHVRAEFDALGVKASTRGPAFGAAIRREWIAPDGFAKSTGGSAKGAHLQTYTSLIHKGASRCVDAAASQTSAATAATGSAADSGCSTSTATASPPPAGCATSR